MKRNIMVFLTVLLVFLGSKSAQACWCRREPLDTEEKFRAAVAKEFHNSFAVFSGEIVEWSKGKIRFKVNRIWKGHTAEEITLSYLYYVREEGKLYVDGCTYEYFRNGKSYLIYADMFENVLQVDGCSRTQPLNEAAQDIKILDDLKTSDDNHSPSSKETLDYAWRNLTTRWTGARVACFAT